MTKVLHIMGCSDIGGISTVVLNYYQHIDRSKIHFDIALTVDNVGLNARKLQELGSTIYFLPLKSSGIKSFKNELKKLIENNEYDAIHVHENETSYVALSVAKECGVKCRIAHSHTTSPTSSIRSEIRRISGCVLNYKYATKIVACGEMAGIRVFGKKHMKSEKALILPNAIDTDLFRFNEEYRDEIRRELSLSDDDYLIGMVGRLESEKNLSFILEMLPKIHKLKKNIKLVIIGEGSERKKFEHLIENLDMSSYVKLLGKKDKVYRYYSAFDLYLLPSLNEGFPLTVVEAISTGLNAFLSSNITDEFRKLRGTKYLPLNENAWINEIVDMPISSNRNLGIDDIKNHNLDISDTTKILQEIYLH